MRRSSAEKAARDAEKLLTATIPEAACVPQEWDNRIDCIISLPDGSVVGEMIRLSDLSKERLKATAERLRMRLKGSPVRLVDEIRSPKRVLPSD
jgi:hypothetical protein